MRAVLKNSLETQESHLTSEIELLLEEANVILELAYSKEKEVVEIREQLECMNSK